MIFSSIQDWEDRDFVEPWWHEEKWWVLGSGWHVGTGGYWVVLGVTWGYWMWHGGTGSWAIEHNRTSYDYMHLFIFSLVQSMKLLITAGSFLLLITAAGADSIVQSNHFVGQKFHSPEMNINQLLIWCTVITNKNVKNKILGSWLLFLHKGSYIFINMWDSSVKWKWPK